MALDTRQVALRRNGMDDHFYSCSSKKAYRSKRVALNVVRRARKNGVTLHIYWCHYSEVMALTGQPGPGHYHVTHKKAPE